MTLHKKTRSYTKQKTKRHEMFVLFSVFIVFSFVLFGVPQARAAAATLKVDPAQGTFFVGSTFDVSLILDTGGETINAIEAELRFPPKILQVTTPTAARSIISIWASPPSYSNTEGFVRFQGGVPAPGLKTSSGVLSVVSFRAVQPGSAALHFTGNSRVLRADGLGTNILGTTFGARYEIAIPPPQGPKVSSITHQDYRFWYRDRALTLSWEKEAGVSEFSWSLDHDPSSVPDTIPEGSQTAVTYDNLEDDLWFFHIRANKQGVWGGVTTFLAKIDATEPAEFKIKTDPPGRLTADTRAMLIFQTTDALSSIARYELKVIDVSGPEAVKKAPFFIEAESPFILPKLDPGIYTVIVRAYDEAGNFREASQQLEIIIGAVSFFSKVPWPFPFFISVSLLSAGGFFALRNFRNHRRVRERVGVGLDDLRARLQQDLGRVHERLRDDHELKQRFSQELETLNHLTQGSKDKPQGISMPTLLLAVGFAAGSLLFGGLPASQGTVLYPASVALAQERQEKIAAPRITTAKLDLASNQLLYLSGVAEPRSIVRITVSGEQYEPIVAQTRANERGDWEYLHGLYLQPGLYEVYAQALDPQTGTVSAQSDLQSVKVTSRALVFGKYVIDFEIFLALVVLVFLIFAAILLGLVVYFRTRTSRTHRQLAKEVREIHEAVRVGFAVLRREVERDLEALEKAAGGGRRALTEKERELRAALLNDFQNIESRIEQEVADVEELV